MQQQQKHRSHLFEKITVAPCMMIFRGKKKRKRLIKNGVGGWGGGLGVGSVAGAVVKYNNMSGFLSPRRAGAAGTSSVFGAGGCVPTLINSGRAALSAQLPPEPRCTITQGGHLRSVRV